jgi:hypothetical protein
MSLHFAHLNINSADVPDDLFKFWWQLQGLAFTSHESVVSPDHYGLRLDRNRAPHPVFSASPDSSVEAEVARVVEERGGQGRIYSVVRDRD